MIAKLHTFFCAVIALGTTCSSSRIAVAEPVQAEAAEAPARQRPLKLEREVRRAVNGIFRDFGMLLGGAGNVKRRVAQDAAREQQIKQMAPQYEQQLRPLFHAELEFIRQHCEVPKDARPKVRAAGEKALKEVALEFCRWQYGVRQGKQSQPNPGREIQGRLTAELVAAVPAESLVKFREKLAARDKPRKEAAIRATVVVLDDKLALSTEQRDAIFQSISSKWQPDWEGWIGIIHYGGNYVPSMPEELVVPHLNDEQKKIWNGLQKATMSSYWWYHNGNQTVPDEEWWGPAPPKDDPAAANVVAPVLLFE